MAFEGHGLAGSREVAFTRLLPPADTAHSLASLAALAKQMAVNPPDDPDSFSIKPDGEENLYVPAGYTYLGQFVDHDLTFDTTSSLDPVAPAPGTNIRSPRFDLDCLYGAGPGDQPYLYDNDHATLLFGCTEDGTKDDLLRIPLNGRAVIGDKRNDENSIVCQIQLAFIKFHNAVVAGFKKKNIRGDALFKLARDEVRWTYQRILVDDFLQRVIAAEVHDGFVGEWRSLRERAYKLYTADKRGNIPIEFAGAAYRFGHSGVRTGYSMNAIKGFSIFNQTDNPDNSLVGFDPLPSNHVIDDWRRFFPDSTPQPGERNTANDNTDPIRLQYAYKIDPSLADPLSALPPKIADKDSVPSPFGFEQPSLALLNLFRGHSFRLASGQAVAKALDLAALDEEYLVTRHKTPSGGFTFRRIDSEFFTDTPLWFYILAEAQKPLVDDWIRQARRDLSDDDLKTGVLAASQLGPVGGRLLMEVFYGLLDADPDSYRNAAPIDWSPPIGEHCTFFKMLEFAGLGGTGL